MGDHSLMDIFHRRAKQFAYAPCLGYTSPGLIRRIGVSDFRDLPECSHAEMFFECFQQESGLTARLPAPLVDFDIGRNVGTDQPGPHRSLMIGGIPLNNAAFIAWPIARVPGRQASQAERSEQLALDHLYDPPLPLRWEHAVMQADREDLVRPYRGIAMFTVDHVVQTAGLRVPELSVEAVFRVLGKLVQKHLRSRVAELVRKIAQNAERVVPERLNLDGFARPGSNNPVADLSVHPGELDAGFTTRQKAIAVETNAITSTSSMPLDDFLQLRIKSRTDKVVIAGVLQVGPDGFE